jgi:hypothetical protein
VAKGGLQFLIKIAPVPADAVFLSQQWCAPQKNGNADSHPAFIRAEGSQLVGLNTMSAIGLSNSKNFAISAYADYRHDMLVFSRVQSQQLRSMEWEGRIKPLHSWISLLGRGAAVLTLAGVILAFFI